MCLSNAHNILVIKQNLKYARNIRHKAGNGNWGRSNPQIWSYYITLHMHLFFVALQSIILSLEAYQAIQWSSIDS